MSPKKDVNRPTTVALVGDALIDRTELGELLAMTPNAISVSMCRGVFPLQPLRIGRRLRWRLSDVRAYLAGSAGAQ